MIFPRLAAWVWGKAWRATRRPPDFVIGPEDNPYMLRWYMLNYKCFKYIGNVYLHAICRSDDDRALHDHPWVSVSFVLRQGYVEHLKDRKIARLPGSIIFRRAKTAHRLELMTEGAATWTLFFVGPKIREWGFHCPKGWRHNEEFATSSEKGSMIGRGCD